MSDIDDILGGISSADAERNDRFETQVVHQLLRHLGLPKPQVAGLEASYGQPLDCQWFNGQGYLEPQFGAGRAFRFSFEDFFCRPTKHPIVQAALEFAGDFDGTTPWIYVFNVHQHGRMAATNLKLRDETHIHVAHPRGLVNIATLGDIITPYKDQLCPL